MQFTVTHQGFHFSLVVSWKWRLFLFRYPLINTPQMNPQLTPVASIVLKITIRHEPRRKHSLYFCRGVFTSSLHSNSRGADDIENSVLLLLRAWMLRTLPSNGRCLQSHCLATGLYATIMWIRFSGVETYTIKVNCLLRLRDYPLAHVHYYSTDRWTLQLIRWEIVNGNVE
jgi:hypothetical protein